MLFHHWLKRVHRLNNKPDRSARRGRPAKASLALEALEQRTLLSVFHPEFKLIRPDHPFQPLQNSNPTGLVPSQIRHAYGIDQVVFGNGTVQGDGTGQTIAIVDAFDDPTIASDLALFDSTLGIAAPPSFTKIAQDGSNNYPGTDPAKGWEVEESLDVEWAHALAPGASILLVEANSPNDSDLNTAVSTAKNYTGVVVVSMSYGSSEFSGETSDDSLYTTPSGHSGVTFVAATGDSGAPGDYPAFSPNVLAAGGTVLTTDNSGDYISETGWSQGGGGISQYEAQPSYQNGFYNSTQRTIPDLAFNAGNGVAIADSFTFGASAPWVSVEGTSISSPSLAALVAIADQGRSQLGQGSLDGPGGTLPEVYQLQAGDIHDITTGNNGFPAGPGYDLVTGRGTPISPLLVHHLVHIPVTRTWTGGGSDSNWSDAANWGGTAPGPGDALVFGSGASAFTAVNDFASGTEFDSITISAAGYNISGNDITLLNGLNAGAATGANSFGLNTTLLLGQTWTAGSPSGTLTLGGNINNDGFTFTVNGSGAVEFDGVISGSGGLTYGGTGTLTLGGSAANTYTGSTTIPSGTLVLNKSSGNAVPGAFTIGTASTTALARLTAAGQIASGAAVTINSSSTLDLNGNNAAIGSLTLTGGAVTTEAGTLTLNGNLTSSGTASVSGNLSLPGATSFTVNSSGTLTVPAAIGGSGSLTKAGTGTLAITVGGSYSGGTTLNAGTLTVGNPAALGTGTLTLAAGTMTATGTAISLANAVSVTGDVTLSGSLGLTFTGTATLTGNRTLTVGSSLTATFSGAVGESGGPASLTKAGGGTLVLAAANSYSGGTTLSAGVLSVGNAGALGSGNLTVDGSTTLAASASGLALPNTVTVAGNFTLGVSNSLTLAGAATLTGNRMISVTSGISGTFAGGVLESSSGRSLTKTGSGTLVLPVADSYGGGTTLNGGTLTIGASGSLGSGNLTLTSGTFSAIGSGLTVQNSVILAGNVTLGGSVNITFNDMWTLTGNRTLTVGGTGIMLLAGTVGESGSGRSLTKSGSGTLELLMANSYSGGTTLSAGTLEIGNAGALGSGIASLRGGTLEATGSALTLTNHLMVAGSVTIGGSFDLSFAGSATLTANSTLTVTNTGTTSFNGAIGESGGARSLTKSGSQLLVLSGANSYSGGTVLSAGTLAVGNASALGTGTLTLRSGTIEAQGGAVSLSNAVVLGGNVTFGGSNDLTFTGAASLTGARTLTVTNTAMTTLAGALSGSFGLTKKGSGTLTLSGTNTYTGTTTINAGTLVVNGTQTGSAVSVTSGGTLAGSGSVGAVTVSSGGTLAPGTPSSTAILSSGNVSLSTGSGFNVVLGGTTPGAGGYDQLNVTGTVNLGNSTLNVSVTFPAAIGDSFTIINNNGTGAVVGTFQGLAEGATFVVNGMTFQITYRGGSNGRSVVLTRIA